MALFKRRNANSVVYPAEQEKRLLADFIALPNPPEGVTKLQALRYITDIFNPSNERTNSAYVEFYPDMDDTGDFIVSATTIKGRRKLSAELCNNLMTRWKKNRAVEAFLKNYDSMIDSFLKSAHDKGVELLRQMPNQASSKNAARVETLDFTQLPPDATAADDFARDLFSGTSDTQSESQNGFPATNPVPLPSDLAPSPDLEAAFHSLSGMTESSRAAIALPPTDHISGDSSDKALLSKIINNLQLSLEGLSLAQALYIALNFRPGISPPVFPVPQMGGLNDDLSFNDAISPKIFVEYERCMDVVNWREQNIVSKLLASEQDRLKIETLISQAISMAPESDDDLDVTGGPAGVVKGSSEGSTGGFLQIDRVPTLLGVNPVPSIDAPTKLHLSTDMDENFRQYCSGLPPFPENLSVAQVLYIATNFTPGSHPIDFPVQSLGHLNNDLSPGEGVSKPISVSYDKCQEVHSWRNQENVRHLFEDKNYKSRIENIINNSINRAPILGAENFVGLEKPTDLTPGFILGSQPSETQEAIRAADSAAVNDSGLNDMNNADLSKTFSDAADDTENKEKISPLRSFISGDTRPAKFLRTAFKLAASAGTTFGLKQAGALTMAFIPGGLIAGAAIGAVVSVATTLAHAKIKGEFNDSSSSPKQRAWKLARSAAMGAIGGAVGVDAADGFEALKSVWNRVSGFIPGMGGAQEVIKQAAKEVTVAPALIDPAIEAAKKARELAQQNIADLEATKEAARILKEQADAAKKAAHEARRRAANAAEKIRIQKLQKQWSDESGIRVKETPIPASRGSDTLNLEPFISKGNNTIPVVPTASVPVSVPANDVISAATVPAIPDTTESMGVAQLSIEGTGTLEGPVNKITAIREELLKRAAAATENTVPVQIASAVPAY